MYHLTNLSVTGLVTCLTEHRTRIQTLVFLLLTFTFVQAQTVNPNFNPQIYTHGRVADVALQPDGKILVSGRFAKYNESTANGLVRLNADGTVDQTFSVGTGTSGGGHLAIQPDGKILFTGSFSDFNGSKHRNIVRLNSDGTVDETFLNNPIFESQYVPNAEPMLLLADGKVMVAHSTSENNQFVHKLYRLASNGTTDNTFNCSIKGSVRAFLPIGDKILVTGYFTEVNGTAVNHIVLLNANGTINHSFGTGPNNGIKKAVLQSDGKILLIGGFSTFNGVSKFDIIRLNADYSVDNTFNGYSARPDDLLVDAANNIYVSSIDFKSIRKLDPNGTEIYIKSDNRSAQHILLQSNGKLLGFGFSQPSDQFSARFNTDFTPDASFTMTTGPRAYGMIRSATTQTDGKIIFAGDFVTFDGYNRGGIVRLNSDLTVDNTFAPEGFKIEVNSVTVYFLKTLPDNKLLVAGQFDSYNGVTGVYQKLIRLKSNGDFDDTFTPATLPFSSANVMAGTKLYMGNFNSPYDIKRFGETGAVDPSFNAILNGRVYYMAVQTDGKLLINGDFTSVNGTTVPKMARLNTDGSLDASFNYTGGGTINQAYCVGTEKILLRGSFLSGDQFASFKLLNLDGSADAQFSAPVGASAGTTAVMPDNSIITYSNLNIERLLPAGPRDQTFAKIPVINDFQMEEILPLSATTFIYRGYVINDKYRVVHVTLPPPPPPPAAPEMISVTANAEGFPRLTWADKSSDELSFIVERAQGAGSFSTLETLGSNTTTFLDKTVKDNTTYNYRVVAKNNVGINRSNAISFSTGIITGIEGENELSVKVHPNPSSGAFELRFGKREDRTINIVNANGVSVQTLRTSDEAVTLNLFTQPAGIYCARVTSYNGSAVVRVLKR